MWIACGTCSLRAAQFLLSAVCVAIEFQPDTKAHQDSSAFAKEVAGFDKLGPECVAEDLPDICLPLIHLLCHALCAFACGLPFLPGCFCSLLGTISNLSPNLCCFQQLRAACIYSLRGLACFMLYPQLD